MYSLNNFDIDIFLNQYWQKKPLVIKQGFDNFVDPLDEHELAGLSQEPSIDSRIISQSNSNWQVSHGPFEDINAHCKGAWSLLVQAVDHVIPEADGLMRAFDFIPHWRMDDLMVSFSNKDAGVGPHLDQYDVFIIQGKGSRRWQVGLPGEFESIHPHKDLSQIVNFEPVIDQVLLPGDIIYIPAHHPHNGVALQECLNYSVGFRAPSSQEMLSSFADFALDNNLFNQRYTDQNIATREFSGEIKQQETARFKQMLARVLESEAFSDWTAQFLSQNGPKQDIDEQYENRFDEKEIKQRLETGVPFVRCPGIKPTFLEHSSINSHEFVFYIQGEKFSVPLSLKNLLLDFLNSPVFYFKNRSLDKSSVFFIRFVATMVNTGYWYPDD
ncbi:cupin domain-containing protein [uncultured Paraglaciecola sp.]|uniref:cupin domain-containing protein n=1 Tax=uncultured Paraglaciecola sp. TaxID=1765024 RepID=UPI002616C656|nr:cupin domain-containing protein [uncultured Paraglaciecola sp.]